MELGSVLGVCTWGARGVSGYWGLFTTALGPAHENPDLLPELEEPVGLEGRWYHALCPVQGIAARLCGVVRPGPGLLSRPCISVLTESEFLNGRLLCGPTTDTQVTCLTQEPTHVS